LYKQVKSNTLVDVYRCFELWELTKSIFTLNPQACFIEIGVWRGGTAAVIGKKLHELNATVDFYLADTFQGVQKSSQKDTFYFDGEHNDTSEQIVNTLISGIYSHYKILKGIFPDETSCNILTEQKFGFCHIDVDVYDSAKDIVDWIWDRMIIGGIIVFDDYGFHSCDGVTRYVNEIKNERNKLVIHNLNGHAILVKLR
jgi:O-methyltransferase